MRDTRDVSSSLFKAATYLVQESRALPYNRRTNERIHLLVDRHALIVASNRLPFDLIRPPSDDPLWMSSVCGRVTFSGIDIRPTVCVCRTSSRRVVSFECRTSIVRSVEGPARYASPSRTFRDFDQAPKRAFLGDRRDSYIDTGIPGKIRFVLQGGKSS